MGVPAAPEALMTAGLQEMRRGRRQRRHPGALDAEDGQDF